MEQRDSYKNIRYSRLHFTVRFLEDTEIVREKSSAIRGGIGEMLLRAHCIADRTCESCGFVEECMVQRVMYSRFTHTPEFMQSGNSVGYVISCLDQKKEFSAGDAMEFCVTLFGKTIVYFSQILNAVYALGMSGLGRNRSRFEIVSVKNLYKEEILDGNNVRMARYRWETLGDYISWRRRRLCDGESCRVRFYTPLSLKYRGELVSELSPESLSEGLWRRMYILSCFEEIPFPEHCPKEERLPDISAQRMTPAEVPRHSSRHDRFMKLHGMKGAVMLENVSEFWLELLLAGEVTHIGKNTSFGFGGYRVNHTEA